MGSISSHCEDPVHCPRVTIISQTQFKYIANSFKTTSKLMSKNSILKYCEECYSYKFKNLLKHNYIDDFKYYKQYLPNIITSTYGKLLNYDLIILIMSFNFILLDSNLLNFYGNKF